MNVRLAFNTHDARLLRLLPRREASSWAYSFFGFLAARGLGLLFSIVATRFLAPAEFGELVYGLTIASIASVFLSSAPIGLSRDLIMAHEDPLELSARYSNWLLALGVLLLVSIVLAPVVALFARLPREMGWGLEVNLLGVAVLETYREAQRGSDRYPEMAASYVLANLLQLLAVVAFGVWGSRSAPLFFAIYGVSPLIMFLLMEGLRPLRLRFRPALMSRAYLRAILAFVLPLGVQSIAFAVWSGADVMFLTADAGTAAAGVYGVAKSLGMVVVMPVLTLAGVLLPLVTRKDEHEIRPHFFRVVTVGVAVTAICAFVLVFPGVYVVRVLFGERYDAATSVLPVVSLGMAFWGAYHLVARLWVGLGRPSVDMYCTIGGMIATLAAGWLLVPPFGMQGAGWTFALGSAFRLVCVAAYTLHALPSPMAVEAHEPVVASSVD